jgi:hypothetical protein
MKRIGWLNKPPLAGSKELIKKASAHFMRNLKWVGLAAVLAIPLWSGYGQTPPAAAPANLSPGAAEVVRLAGSGIGDDVVLAYIQNSQAPFNLSADDVLYLKDLGLSPQVTSAMLSHDTTLRNPPQPNAPAAPAPAMPPPGAPTAPAPAVPSSPVTAPPPAYVGSPPADVSYFYNDLLPYGTWVSLEGYGWCWQPRTVVTSRGWRPYCDGGHWVYTDAGWFWQSDYSWGWAPFHYGRWYLHPRSGWVWLPDRVWGPAWVTWRVAGDTCGWAPLPPRAEFDLRLGWRFNGASVRADFDFGLGVNAFAFVALGDFCNHDLGHRCLPPARVTAIFRQTAIVNNYVVNNNIIVNRGIAVERVSVASRVPVPRATIRDLPAGSAGMPGRTASVVYRAQLQAPARSVNMVAQKVDTQHPVIQHAPVAPGRTAQPSAFSRSGSAPVAAPRRPVVEAPKVSPWSSSAKPASSPSAPTPVTSKPSSWTSSAQPSSSPQYQSTPRTTPQPAPMSATPKAYPSSSNAKPAPSPQPQQTSKTYQPAATAPSAPAAARLPDEWKQGTRSAPGYRSDTGLPAYYNSHTAAQSQPAAAQTPARGRNTPAYYPKGYHQAAEIKSLPPLDQGQSAAPSSPANGAEPRSKNKQ